MKIWEAPCGKLPGELSRAVKSSVEIATKFLPRKAIGCSHDDVPWKVEAA
uniref:Uncharacterized protein n=1 Tax=Rhizobium meliloti TaxID=382 RepID=I2E235_RHIML|nr:short hypothetical protein [Sinorhizobium meliloti]